MCCSACGSPPPHPPRAPSTHVRSPFPHLLFPCDRDYLQQLLHYLLSFYERTQPLSQVQKQLQKLVGEVEAAWKEGQVRVAGYGGSGMEGFASVGVSVCAAACVFVREMGVT